MGERKEMVKLPFEQRFAVGQWLTNQAQRRDFTKVSSAQLCQEATAALGFEVPYPHLHTIRQQLGLPKRVPVGTAHTRKPSRSASRIGALADKIDVLEGRIERLTCEVEKLVAAWGFQDQRPRSGARVCQAQGADGHAEPEVIEPPELCFNGR